MRRVKNGDYVKVCYTGRLESGEVFDATEECRAIEIHVGAGEVTEGFEEALIGMAEQEKKQITLRPDEAYGERDERLEQRILRSSFPLDYQPKVGAVVGFRTPKGEQLPATIVSVEEEHVGIDFNHPLAGMTVTYDLEVAEIHDRPSASPSTCSTSSCCCEEHPSGEGPAA